MNSGQREQIRKKILLATESLSTSIKQLEEASKPVSLDQPIGRLSRMDSIANQAISERMLVEAKTRIHKLEYALTRLDEEDFGVCAECGGDIPLGRLLVMPEAIYCVNCAE